MLASKTSKCDSPIDKITREYLFDEKAILTNDIHLYYWFYPFDCTIIRHNVNQLNPFKLSNEYYSVLKSFPLGFAISYGEPLEILCNLTKYNTNNFQKERDIPLVISSQYPMDYPEQLRYSGVQLISDKSNDVFAIRKLKK